MCDIIHGHKFQYFNIYQPADQRNDGKKSIELKSSNMRISRQFLLKPTGHVMHHQFNIQQLYALPTLYLCVLYLSENKQRLVPLTA